MATVTSATCEVPVPTPCVDEITEIGQQEVGWGGGVRVSRAHAQRIDSTGTGQEVTFDRSNTIEVQVEVHRTESPSPTPCVENVILGQPRLILCQLRPPLMLCQFGLVVFRSLLPQSAFDGHARFVKNYVWPTTIISA